MDCGLFWALSVTTRVAVLEPLAVGLKVTVVVHPVAFGARVAVQVVVLLKSPALVPVMAKLVIESAVPPGFERVMDLVAVPLLALTVPKLRLLALNCATGLMTVAETGTCCGLPAALSVILSTAVCGL